MKVQVPLKKSTLSLYRDCLRAIRYTAARSPKARAMKEMVESEFRQNRDLIEFNKIQECRQRAFEGLNNFLLIHHIA
jgi:hypothetical protein